MSGRISAIKNDVQDRSSSAWKKLCEYVDEVAESGAEEFLPQERLGDQFLEIYTLPESISKLKRVKKLWLYGSKLKRIPPEIGQMESLEFFDPYTSYDLHWFPYEITRCKLLSDSRISTRALYGNYKNRMGFPRLDHNPVRYSLEDVRCSICDKEIAYTETNQLWITCRIATDTIPLLANICSLECEEQLLPAADNYVRGPHKGGAELVQPPTEHELWEAEVMEYSSSEKGKVLEAQQKSFVGKLFKPIWKIWEKD